MVSRFPFIAWFVLSLSACGGDDEGGGSTPMGGGAGGAGSAGASVGGAPAGAGSGGTTAQGGTAARGGSGGTAAGQGGSGGQLSGGELEEAAVRACGQVCALVTQACPDISASVCAGTCQQQAESFAESGRCGAEHYAVLTCVLATQSASTITCVSSSQWQYAGCQGELVAYTECVGG